MTDYSSTTDFCTGPLAHPVRFRLILVQEGEYFDHAGQVWAEAGVDHAAEQMRHVAKQRLKHPEHDPALATPYRERFAFTEVGRHYNRRLQELWLQRHSLASSVKATHFDSN